MNGTLTRQWHAPVLVTHDDGADTIEPGLWIAVLLDEGKVIDGDPALTEYKACAGQSEIDGMGDAAVKTLLLSRITKARQRRWTPQVVLGPGDDLGVGDLTGPVEVA